jgi:hypothetical protein
MGRIVYAAAMSHVLHPPYYEKNVGAHGWQMVEELIIGCSVQRCSTASPSAIPSTRRFAINELGGSLHRVLSIPGLSDHYR